MFDHLSEFPTYNIKAVTRKTGLTAPTLRAWERRYNVLTPTRSEGNYRLYSDRDIATLQWLSGHIREGLSISGAVALLEQQRRLPRPQQGAQPAYLAENPPEGPNGFLISDVVSLQVMVERLHLALVRMDERQARMILADAHATYSLEDVCVKLISPALTKVGDDWHHQLISTVNEHFATAFLMGRLYSYLNTQDPGEGGLVLVGCVQGERHEISALMMTLLLRRKQINARYIGADVPSDDLLQTIWIVKPRAVVLSAMMPESGQVANKLAAIAGAHSQTYFLLGGNAFRDLSKWENRTFPPNLKLLGTDMQAALTTVHELVRVG